MPRGDRAGRPERPAGQRAAAPASEGVPLPYQAVRSDRLPELVARQITERVVSGLLRPGTPLPGEHELARQFGVSRPVVREALRLLAGRGLVETRSGRSAVIASREAWNILDPALILALGEGRVEPVIRQVLEVRRIVEVEAAALAAERATLLQVERLRQATAEMERHQEDLEAYVAADGDFHATILQATGNEVLLKLFEPVGALIEVGRLITHGLRPSVPGQPRRSIAAHRAILEAIAARDPAAARAAMERHLAQTEEDFAAIMPWNQGLQRWLEAARR